MNIALIGCGEHSRTNLLPCLLLRPEVEVSAVCDPDPSALQAAAAVVRGARAYADYSNLLRAENELDAVVVVATPQVHCSVAEKSLRCGLHVFTEKPPAASSAELITLAELARETGLVTAVGHNLRFARGTTEFLSRLGHDEADSAVAVDIRYVASGPRGSRWGQSPLRNLLLSHAIHVIDLAVHCGGPVASLSADAAWARDGGIVVTAQLRFQSGQMATIWVTNAGTGFRVDLWGIAKSGVVVHLDALNQLRVFGGTALGTRWSEMWQPRILETGYALAGYEAEISGFIDAIVSGKGMIPSFEDEVAVYEVMDRIEAQIETQRSLAPGVGLR